MATNKRVIELRRGSRTVPVWLTKVWAMNNPHENAARRASQEYETGVDPYNTVDRLLRDMELQTVFAEWLENGKST